jgi:hypothetical protein
VTIEVGTEVAVGDAVVAAAGGSGVAVCSLETGPFSPHADARAIKRIKGMNSRAEIGFPAIRYMVSSLISFVFRR